MEKLFHFLHFFHSFPRLNRKTRFSRSEILKNLNICPSKDRHLTCYTCYPFADFLHYGVMDLVKSFWSLFVWILAMGKIQKEPGSIPKGLEFSYNGKSCMIPNYVSTPFHVQKFQCSEILLMSADTNLQLKVYLLLKGALSLG